MCHLESYTRVFKKFRAKRFPFFLVLRRVESVGLKSSIVRVLFDKLAETISSLMAFVRMTRQRKEKKEKRKRCIQELFIEKLPSNPEILTGIVPCQFQSLICSSVKYSALTRSCRKFLSELRIFSAPRKLVSSIEKRTMKENVRK